MQVKDRFGYARLCFIAVGVPLDAWGAVWLVQRHGWGLFWEAWLLLAVFVVFPAIVCFLTLVCLITGTEWRAVRAGDGK